jgi:hypothetical protein
MLNSIMADNSRHEFKTDEKTHTIQAGSLIRPEQWSESVRLAESRWDRAEFRIPSASYHATYSHVNVAVTGRFPRKIAGFCGRLVRVSIEFVGDGEKSVTEPGWWMIDG